MEEETTVMADGLDNVLLWFDVVMEEETTKTGRLYSVRMLWFDVVMEEETTVLAVRMLVQCCGLM